MAASNSDNGIVIIANEIIQSGMPNYQGCQIPVSSQLKTGNWEWWLQQYWDQDVAKMVKYGWPINISYNNIHGSTFWSNTAENNHKGAIEFIPQVQNYIDSEVTGHTSIGPFEESPFVEGRIKVSPLNSVSKKDSSERRIILDCSFPEGNAVNDFISKDSYLGENMALTYPTVDNFSALIRTKGVGCLLFKRDLRKAYRQIKIDPGDIPVLGFKWQGKIYFDTVLAMGLRSAAYICQRLTSAVKYIFSNMGFEVLNYIDDFGGVENPDKAWEAFAALAELFQLLGLEESAEKAVPPNSCMLFLGIQFDTLAMTMSIDSVRLEQIQTELSKWVFKNVATRKEVESLVGVLNFVAKCVRPARPFMARMFDCLKEMPRKGVYEVSEEFRLDVKWWLNFLPEYNGVSLIPVSEWASVDSILESDACLSGCGAIERDV